MITDYERVGVVARGAHSTIWKGFDPGLKREVALKQLSGSDAGEAARREAAALAGLRHPNILSVYDVLDDTDGVWLIEQWITGAPLSAVLAKAGKLRAIDALALIHGALHGLSYAHGRDLIHGDISPSNILIDHSGTPMLVDFGLAVAPGQTSLGGTPGYMAPEAAAGQTVDKRSDVYSSCVVLAELLTGTRLFTGSSLAATHRQSIGATDLDGIETPVAAVLSTGLDTTPDIRPADAGVLLTALEEAIEKTHGRAWIAGAGLGAIGTTAATIAVGTDLTTTTASAGATTNAAAAKPTTVTISRGNVIAAAAVVAAVIIAIIAFVLLRPSPHLSTASGTTTPPAAVVAATPTAQAAESWAGVYKIHMLSRECAVPFFPNDWDAGVAQNGNSMTFINEHGSLNADGSFVASGPNYVWRGVFATDGGQSVIRDGDVTLTVAGTECHGTFTATKE